MDPRIEKLLTQVEKPARYTGGEYGEIIKDKDSVNLRFALCFPDIYEIGMSNLGIRILYGVLNSMDDVWCERVFEPWRDMSDLMRKNNVPLWALESGDPIKDFDIIGFSVGYEMSYPGVLDMLTLAGLPLRSADRESLSPLIFAGGTCMYNCEPIADFIDLAVIGEGEEADPELVTLFTEAKRNGLSKKEFLRRAAHIDGIYVPSLYNAEYSETGVINSITANEGAPEKVRKRLIGNIDKSFFPVRDIVPSTEIVHDRAVLELFRGCIRGCRFCQAGFVYRPVRSKSVQTLIEQGISALKNSGYQEISLSSLSSSDYRGLNELCDGLLDYCEPSMTRLSLPSLRADNFSMELMKRVQKVRRSALTFAPEAGSQRLRDIINKNITEEDLLNSCRNAFEGGWTAVKLYFMLGLPTETDEDVLQIADLTYKVLECFKKYASNKARGINITVSTSCFIPKPMTPFQWEAQVDIEEYSRRTRLLRDRLRSRSITYNWHDPRTGFVEAVLARGDRRLAPALESLVSRQGGLQAWDEYFDYDGWLECIRKNGIEPSFYATRERNTDEILPWSIISDGVNDSYLLRELERAKRGETTPDCREKCSGCGASLMAESGVCDE